MQPTTPNGPYMTVKTVNDGYGIVDFTAGSNAGGAGGSGGIGSFLSDPAIARAISADLMSALAPKSPGILGGGGLATLENSSWAGASGVQDSVHTASWTQDLQSLIPHSS
jgi:hypothetical protein